MKNSTKEHWNTVYASKPVQQLGWYETEPTISLEMIESCGIEKSDPILDVGAGATTLIDALLQRNFTNITALDISAAALEKLRIRLGEAQAAQVNWLVANITNPADTAGLQDFVLWHDRAMLHFLTDEVTRQAYRTTLEQALRPGGFAIIAAFAKEGATQCSGLDVQRYDAQSLSAFLGPTFELKESRALTYQMPSGDLRPYVYTRFQKRIE